MGWHHLAWRSCTVVALWLAAVAAIAADPQPDSAAERSPADRPPLRVGVMVIAGGSEWTGDQPSGVMIDVWEDLAGRLGLRTEFVRIANFSELLETTRQGKVDVALGPIAITEEREKIIDLTHPVFHSGQRIAVRQRHDTGLAAAIGSLVSLNLLKLFGLVVGLAIVSGHVLWLCERWRNSDCFPASYPRGIWEAIWWIASTIVTGGCDDKHVDTVAGRALAFAWMIGGIVLVAAFTSALTATMTADRVTGVIRSPRDLAGRIVGCQQMAITVQLVKQRGGVPQEYPTMNDAIEALELGLVEAVVGENQTLMFLLGKRKTSDVRIVGPIFDPFDYGIGLPSNSAIREQINTALLRMREDGTLERIRSEWFGTHD